MADTILNLDAGVPGPQAYGTISKPRSFRAQVLAASQLNLKKGRPQVVEADGEGFSPKTCSYRSQVMLTVMQTDHFGVEGYIDNLDSRFKELEQTLFSPGPKRFHKERKHQFHRIHRYMARTGLVAIRESASMFSRRVKDVEEESRFRSLRRRRSKRSAQDTSDLGDFAAHDSEFLNGESDLTFDEMLDEEAEANINTTASQVTADAWSSVMEGLAAAAHDVLQTPWGAGHIDADDEDDESPVALFWAVNLCIICVFLSLWFVVSAFAVNFQAASSMDPQLIEHEMECSDCLEPTQADRKWSTARLVSVMFFSFVSGSGLVVIHPRRCFLLAGF